MNIFGTYMIQLSFDLKLNISMIMMLEFIVIKLSTIIFCLIMHFEYIFHAMFVVAFM